VWRLARLYVSESVPLWILDEPFTALDVRGVANLSTLLPAISKAAEPSCDHAPGSARRRRARRKRVDLGSPLPCLPPRRGCSVLNTFVQIIRRDSAACGAAEGRRPQYAVLFVVVVTSCPWASGPEPNLLRSIAPGVSGLRAAGCDLSLPGLFANDHATDARADAAFRPNRLTLIVLARRSRTGW